MNIISKNNVLLILGIVLLLFSCTTQQPFLEGYEIDEAYWKPGESFGAPQPLSGSALSSRPQSSDEDFYSADAAKRNSYAPSYLDSTQSGQMNGMVPVWDPIMGWRMVYDPNSSVNSGASGYGSNYGLGYGSGYNSGSYGSSLYNGFSPYGGVGYGYSPFNNYGGLNPYVGMGLNFGMQSYPYWGNSMGMYNGWGNNYYSNPFGYGYGNGMYNPYYWNGWNNGYGNGSTGNSTPDVSTHSNRPGGGVGHSGGQSGNLVVHRHPKSLNTNLSGPRGKVMADVLEKKVQQHNASPGRLVPPAKMDAGKGRPVEQHNTTPSRTQPTHQSNPAPVRTTPSRPAESRGSMVGGGSRPSGGGGSAPSRSSGGSAPHSGGRRP